jgi:hypothetical protein
MPCGPSWDRESPRRARRSERASKSRSAQRGGRNRFPERHPHRRAERTKSRDPRTKGQACGIAETGMTCPRPLFFVLCSAFFPLPAGESLRNGQNRSISTAERPQSKPRTTPSPQSGPSATQGPLTCARPTGGNGEMRGDRVIRSHQRERIPGRPRAQVAKRPRRSRRVRAFANSRLGAFAIFGDPGAALLCALGELCGFKPSWSSTRL